MRFAQVFQRLALVVGILGFASQPSLADDGASAFVSDLGAKALTILADSTNLTEREPAFAKLFTEDFDVPTIGRFVLGRFWRTMTPEQQAEYLDTFKRYVVWVYSTRFSGYSGQGFDVLGSKPVEEGANLVSSRITSTDGSQPIQIDWRVIKVDGAYKITDVVVEGVSMLVTQRQEFSSIINQNGGKVQPLIDMLKKKLVQN